MWILRWARTANPAPERVGLECTKIQTSQHSPARNVESGMPPTDWTWFTGAALCSIGALILGLWAILGDQPRGRRRCPKCWSDMGAPPSLACPSCNHTAHAEHQLWRSRRRWRNFVFAGGSGLLAVACVLTPAARNGWDWWTAVPTSILIEALPLTGLESSMGSELLQRYGYKSLKWDPLLTGVSAQDIEYLAWRIAQGNVFARPISARWRSSYGKLASQASHVLFNMGPASEDAGDDPPPLTDDSPPAVQQARKCSAMKELLKLPSLVEVSTRPRWPKGIPLYVHVLQGRWWPGPTSSNRCILPKPSSDRDQIWRAAWSGYTLVQTPSSGKGEVSIHLGVERSLLWRHWKYRNDELVEDRTFVVTYTIGGEAEEIIKPVSSPSLDQLLASAVRIPQDGSLNCNMHYGGTRTPEASGIAFGILVETLLNGQVQRTQRMWWRGTPGFDEFLGVEDLKQDKSLPLLVRHPNQNEQWSVRIRSDVEAALRVLDCDRYWKGEINIPLPPPPSNRK